MDSRDIYLIIIQICGLYLICDRFKQLIFQQVHQAHPGEDSIQIPTVASDQAEIPLVAYRCFKIHL